MTSKSSVMTLSFSHLLQDSLFLVLKFSQAEHFHPTMKSSELVKGSTEKMELIISVLLPLLEELSAVLASDRGDISS